MKVADAGGMENIAYPLDLHRRIEMFEAVRHGHDADPMIFNDVYHRDMLFAAAQNATERLTRQYRGERHVDLISPLLQIGAKGDLDPIDPKETPPPIDDFYWDKLSKGVNPVVETTSDFGPNLYRVWQEIDTHPLDPKFKKAFSMTQAILNLSTCLDQIITDVDTVDDGRFRYRPGERRGAQPPLPLDQRQQFVEQYVHRLVYGFDRPHAQHIHAPGFAAMNAQLPSLHVGRREVLASIYPDQAAANLARDVMSAFLTLKVSKREPGTQINQMRAPVLDAMETLDPVQMRQALLDIHHQHPHVLVHPEDFIGH